MLLLFFALCTTLDEATRKMLLREGGPIELPSAILHFACFALVVVKGGGSFFRKYPYFTLMPMLFGMRELDFDKRFTTTGIFKSRFYLRPDVPLHEKLIGAMVILTIAVLVVMMLRNHAREFVIQLRNRSVTATGAAITLALCVSSKTLDGLERKCRGLGFQLNEVVAAFSSPAEEILELGIPVIMILAFSHYFNQQRQSSASQLS
jgi:hypothetical protein